MFSWEVEAKTSDMLEIPAEVTLVLTRWLKQGLGNRAENRVADKHVLGATLSSFRC